jgi:hypothetical protein
LAEEIRAYLLSALSQIAAGADADSAFALKRHQGRQKSATDRDLAIVAFITLLMRPKPQTGSANVTDRQDPKVILSPRDMTESEAKNEFLDKLGSVTDKHWDTRRVEQIIAAHRRSLEATPIHWPSSAMLP